jgi:hypothetical protein
MKPMLKPPGTKHLKLNCYITLSSFAFKFNLRRYSLEQKIMSICHMGGKLYSQPDASELIGVYSHPGVKCHRKAGAYTRPLFSTT